MEFWKKISEESEVILHLQNVKENKKILICINR